MKLSCVYAGMGHYRKRMFSHAHCAAYTKWDGAFRLPVTLSWVLNDTNAGIFVSEPPLDPLQKAIQDRLKRARELRKKFYIADGGFTDIQNLWNYEENLLKEGNEFEIWHRRHDFWLLVGIITYPFWVKRQCWNEVLYAVVWILCVFFPNSTLHQYIDWGKLHVNLICAVGDFDMYCFTTELCLKMCIKRKSDTVFLKNQILMTKRSWARVSLNCFHSWIPTLAGHTEWSTLWGTKPSIP